MAFQARCSRPHSLACPHIRGESCSKSAGALRAAAAAPGRGRRPRRRQRAAAARTCRQQSAPPPASLLRPPALPPRSSSWRDYVGFCLGLTSIVFWVFAQVRGCCPCAARPRRRLTGVCRSAAAASRHSPAGTHSCCLEPLSTRPACRPLPPRPPQLPQFISNFKNKSAEALSPWFLAQWLLGDTFNLTGALMQGQQLPTTTYTAM